MRRATWAIFWIAQRKILARTALCIIAIIVGLVMTALCQGSGSGSESGGSSGSEGGGEMEIDSGGLRLVSIGVVAPDIISLSLVSGVIEYGSQSAYVASPADVAEKDVSGLGWVRRKGKLLGSLVGPADDILATLDKLRVEKINTGLMDAVSSYAVTSPDDNIYASVSYGIRPIAVWRKSRPIGLARTDVWTWRAPQSHTVYLKLPLPLKVDKRYSVQFIKAAEGFQGKLPLVTASFTHNPAKVRSEAIHVSQVGFRPDDPGKVAFVSCWLGSGGSLSYPTGMRFKVLDAATGKPAFEGKLRLSKAMGSCDEDPYKRDYNLTNVYEMDFTSLKKPGVYRICVDGVGCSHPFSIAPDVWRRAFTTAAKGFYSQRSGIAVGLPYSQYARPRAFHPADGVKVYVSTCTLLDSGNGLNALGTDSGNFTNLVSGATTELVPNAWGGYFDAGDWDRRIQHLGATRLLLELVELFPAFFRGVATGIPETGNGIPDVIDEAMWNLDFYARLQTPDGGVRGGIESEEHPMFGEASWQNSLRNFAYAPDPWSSYIYAGVAARASLVLEEMKPEFAKRYRKSALAAMAWAEAELPKYERRSVPLPHAVRDERNLAAAELFRLTKDARWNRLFLSTTAFRDAASDLFVWQSHEQSHAAFVYARTEVPGVNKDVKANCRSALLREATATAEFGRSTAFRWTKSQPWAPLGWGRLSVPDAVNLLRAHAMTGKWEFLRAAVLACQFGAGSNPMNMAMTTGVGHSYPAHPLIVDARVTAQTPPIGITVYGPLDTSTIDDNDFAAKLIAPYCHPALTVWPATEAYFDVYMYPGICEFTVHETIGPNAYVWGYLAARH